MKIFLIIIGCIFLYIFGSFITFILCLYCERLEFGPSIAYDKIDADYVGILLLWPITIWFMLGYFLYLKFRKYAIAITETLYQMNHKENKDENDD